MHSAAHAPSSTQADTARPPRLSHLAERLVVFSERQIQRDMENIWYDIQDIAVRAFAEDHGEATWVAKPTVELLDVYQLVFGADYRSRILAMRPLTGLEALQACLAAALYTSVFEKVLPWDGPEEMVARNKGEASYIQRILTALSMSMSFP